MLDTRNDPQRLLQIAIMCDRAGIDALWVRDSVPAAEGPSRDDAWTVLSAVAAQTQRARLGALLIAGSRPAALWF